MGRRNRGMYQNGRSDGRDGMDGMHSDVIPFALTPSPRKVPPPRKLFSNCPVRCGPALPIPPIGQFYLLAWSTLDAPGAYLVFYTVEGKLLHQNLDTFEYMPGQNGRAARRAGQPSGREGRGLLLPAPRPSTNTRKPFGNVFCSSISNFQGGPEELKVPPAT